MGFSRQEHWSGLPFPSPGNLPDPGVELRSPALQAESLPSEPPGYTTEYYSLIKKRNEIMPFAATWMDLEIIILGELSQKEKDKHAMISFICEIQKKII